MLLRKSAQSAGTYHRFSSSAFKRFSVIKNHEQNPSVYDACRHVVGRGVLSVFSRLAFLTPWLIFTMLLLTYCNLSLRRVRPTAMHGWLISIQVLGSVAVYLLLRPLDEVLAQAVMVCLLAPTATSAPVITRLLGGSVESLTTYSLMCNAVVAVLAPLMFSWAGGGGVGVVCGVVLHHWTAGGRVAGGAVCVRGCWCGG